MAGNNSIQILRGNGQAIANAVMNGGDAAKLLDGQPFYNTDKNYLTIGKNVNSFPIDCRKLTAYSGDRISISNSTELVSYVSATPNGVDIAAPKIDINSSQNINLNATSGNINLNTNTFDVYANKNVSIRLSPYAAKFNMVASNSANYLSFNGASTNIISTNMNLISYGTTRINASNILTLSSNGYTTIDAKNSLSLSSNGYTTIDAKNSLSLSSNGSLQINGSSTSIIGERILSLQKGTYTYSFPNASGNVALVENVSNPNLLINPDFRINQRGKTAYNAPGIDKTYTVDRWCLQYMSGADLSISDDYITVLDGNLLQYIEDYKKLSNKTVTLSVQWKGLNSGALKVSFVYWSDTATFTALDSSIMSVVAGEATNLRTDNITFTIPDLSNSTAAAIRFYKDNFSSSAAYAIYWVKLEEGSAATPFVSPDYTTELLKCQRYYVNFNDTNIAYPGYLLDSKTARAIITLPVAMRGRPTITLNSGISAVRVMVNGNIITPSSGTIQFAKQNQLVYSLTIPTTSSGAYPCVVRFLQHFSADAEL